MVLKGREWALFLGLVAIDQVTKAIARASQPANDLFALTWNTGGGFGMFKEYGDVLLVTSIIVLTIVALTIRATRGRERIALMCFAAGIAGNAIDRIAFGSVTDFINVLGFLNFPVFNIADSLITLSIAYLLADAVRTFYASWRFRNGRGRNKHRSK